MLLLYNKNSEKTIEIEMHIKFSELSKKLHVRPVMPLPSELYGLLRNKKVIAMGKHKLRVNGIVKSITIDQTLINTGPNRWNVLGKVVGNGGFGTVYSSSLKITFQEGKAWLEPADDVIKSISLGSDPDQTFQAITAEANFQKRHRITVYPVVRDGNQAYIVAENCGITLAELLARRDLDFDTRIKLLVAIANELLLLEQTGVVHRDLKPSNICIKNTPQGFRATVIDFGLAQPIQRPDYEDWGTLGYISPETFFKKASTHASDRWAFAAIAGEILDCENADLFKDALSVSGPYNYETLLKTVNIPSNVDPILIKDLKALLSNQCSINPNKREPLDLIIKFLLLIPTRRAMFSKFTQQWHGLEASLQGLQEVCRSLNITNEGLSTESILKGKVNFDYANPLIKQQLNKFKNDIVHNIKELKPLSSHLSETKRLLSQNLTAQEYKLETPDLSLISRSISAFTQYLKTIHQYTPKLTESLGGQHFVGSNSSGTQRIQAIIQTSKSPLEKLILLKELGQSKTKTSLSNWYSRSHFFGNGRHANMETLYSKLAALSSEPEKLAGQLNELGQYTRQHNFSAM